MYAYTYTTHIQVEKTQLQTRFFGLRFPSTDIPPQARRLYTKNRLRIVQVCKPLLYRDKEAHTKRERITIIIYDCFSHLFLLSCLPLFPLFSFSLFCSFSLSIYSLLPFSFYLSPLLRMLAKKICPASWRHPRDTPPRTCP